MLLQTVTEVVLLISATKIHWRVQPTAARWNGRFNKMHRALHALHVSLNNSSTRTVHRCLKRNNGHLITLHIWMEWRYHVWGAMHEAILKSSSELKITLEKVWDIFPQVQLIKLSRILQVVWQESMNHDGRHSKHLSLLKKSVHTYSICAVLNS